MISYEPFWRMIREKNITTYALIYKLNISNGTLYRMRKGKNINTSTIDQICIALHCKVEDIMVFVDDSAKE